MKILITGAVGFIGSNLCIHLLNNGHEIIAFDNISNPSIDPTDRIKKSTGQNWTNFKFYKCDIRNYDQMLSFAINDKPDIIVHLAALGSVPRSFNEPGYVADVNINGFIAVTTLARQLGIKRIVFASSSSVYGDATGPRVEDNIGEQLSPYALTKRTNECLAKMGSLAYGLEYVGLRFFNVYGPGQLVDSPYSAVIPRFINSKEITIFGDGETVRDFTYVDDVCEAIELSLTTDAKNEIFNVCTGQGTSLKKLANLCKGKREVKHVESRLGDIKESIGVPFKAEVFLKFKAVTDIEEGIEKTIKYYEGLRNIHSL
jgi:UDP-N-acetylglucosamine 4-epimerase